jgi:hypothetical protein
VDSAEWCLANNALIVLRYSCEEAGGIIEDPDRDWGTTFRRPAFVLPSTEPRPKALPFRKPSQQKQYSEELKERELRKLDPRRQDLVRRIVEGHPENEVGAGGATEAPRTLTHPLLFPVHKRFFLFSNQRITDSRLGKKAAGNSLAFRCTCKGDTTRPK